MPTSDRTQRDDTKVFTFDSEDAFRRDEEYGTVGRV